MAGNMSDYLEVALLNHVFRNTPYTSPTTVYAALFLTTPGETNIGSEVVGNGYVRKAVAFTSPVQISNIATIFNSADISFPAATGSWGTVAYIGLMDALTGGNLLFYGPLTNVKAIDIGDIVKFIANDLIASLD